MQILCVKCCVLYIVLTHPVCKITLVVHVMNSRSAPRVHFMRQDYISVCKHCCLPQFSTQQGISGAKNVHSQRIAVRRNCSPPQYFGHKCTTASNKSRNTHGNSQRRATRSPVRCIASKVGGRGTLFTKCSAVPLFENILMKTF